MEATVSARRRAGILSTVVRDIPREFWEDMRARTRQTYLDAFHRTQNETNLLDQQRLASLYQSRHFRMEHLLHAVAAAHDMACSATLLVENKCHYVYASRGAIGLTQAYVPSIGEMPKPARFRERHSAINRIITAPQLDFGLEAPELLEAKEFYGLIAHNPVGKRFTVEDQTLGMIQLCVPDAGCSSWAAQFTVHEIIAAYTTDTKADRGPEWKRPVEDDKKKASE